MPHDDTNRDCRWIQGAMTDRCTCHLPRRVVWFKASNGQWISGIARAGQSAAAKLEEMSNNETEIIVTKPQGMTPSEWAACMRKAVHVEPSPALSDPE